MGILRGGVVGLVAADSLGAVKVGVDTGVGLVHHITLMRAGGVSGGTGAAGVVRSGETAGVTGCVVAGSAGSTGSASGVVKTSGAGVTGVVKVGVNTRVCSIGSAAGVRTDGTFRKSSRSQAAGVTSGAVGTVGTVGTGGVRETTSSV